WDVRGYFVEGTEWLTDVLTAATLRDALQRGRRHSGEQGHWPSIKATTRQHSRCLGNACRFIRNLVTNRALPPRSTTWAGSPVRKATMRQRASCLRRAWP